MDAQEPELAATLGPDRFGRNLDLPAETLGPDRFGREIEIAAKLSHPHVLPLHDSGDADGLLYYVMPYVKGESLRERLERRLTELGHVALPPVEPGDDDAATLERLKELGYVQ